MNTPNRIGAADWDNWVQERNLYSLTGLDPQGIRVLKRSLTDRAERGAAVMISSHLLAMVEDLCTHVLILATGSQRFFGPIDDLRKNFDHVDESAKLEDMFFAATAG